MNDNSKVTAYFRGGPFPDKSLGREKIQRTEIDGQLLVPGGLEGNERLLRGHGLADGEESEAKAGEHLCTFQKRRTACRKVRWIA